MYVWCWVLLVLRLHGIGTDVEYMFRNAGGGAWVVHVPLLGCLVDGGPRVRTSVL